MSRRTNGDGTVYRRKDGRWEGAATVSTLAGTRRRVRVYGATKSAAVASLRKVLASAENGQRLPEKAWRLDAFLDHWLEHIVRPTRRSTTYVSYAFDVNHHLKPALGRRLLTQLSLREVQRHLNEELHRGASVRNVHKQRTTLSTALTRAVREGLVAGNVTTGVELPARQSREVVPWSADQVRAFLQATRDHQYFPAFLLISVYGLRRGEVLGLRWRDVDLAAGLLRIRHQLQPVDGRLEYVSLKTRSSARDLPLLPQVRAMLTKLRTTQQAVPEEPVVQATGSRRAVGARNLLRGFQVLSERAGLPVIPLHHLRHGAATLLKNQGVPVRDVQSILGHANVQTTLAIYQHGDVQVQHEAIAGMERALLVAVSSPRCRQLSRQTAGFGAISWGGLGVSNPRPSGPQAQDTTPTTAVAASPLLRAHQSACLLAVGGVAVDLAVRPAAEP